MRLLPVLPSALLYLACQFVLASEAPDAAQAGASRRAPYAVASAIEAPVLAAVRAVEHRRSQAVASRDIASLRKLISGDYHHVETTGRARTKTEFLQSLVRNEFEFRSYEVQDMEISLLDNGRAALVTGRFRADVNGGNRPPELRGRFVRMWMLGADGWRNTMQQSTEIRSVPPQCPPVTTDNRHPGGAAAHGARHVSATNGSVSM